MSKKTQALRRGEVLVMKVVEADGSSYGGFIWPTEVGAVVEAPDWKPTKECGNGLHGWLWGVGSLSVCNGLHENPDAVWMALAVPSADVIDLDGKVKFPRCRIAFRDDRTAVANFIAARRPANTPAPMFGQAAAGEAGQAAAGYAGQAAAGEAGQAAAGEAGQAAAGYAGQAAAGEAGQAAAGEAGQAAAGYAGQAAAGEAGQAAAGEAGQAAAGYAGQAAAGEAGQAAAGEAGQAAAGYAGQAAAGEAGQAAAGEAGQAAAGYAGQAAAGEAGQAAAGEAGQAAAGYAGQAAAGEAGQAAAGEAGQAAAGYAGQAAAGEAGQAAAGEAGQAAAGSRGQAAVEADGLATCGIGGLVRGGANAVLVAMFSTGPQRSDFSYSVGQVGRAGIEADVWYEGSGKGLRRVGDDDARVKSWVAAWKLFDERKAAREALLEKSNAAHRGVLADNIASSIKPLQ
jgi:hypothetical protein